MAADLIARLEGLLAEATPGPLEVRALINPSAWDICSSSALISIAEVTHSLRERANADLLAEAVNSMPVLIRAAKALRGVRIARCLYCAFGHGTACDCGKAEADEILKELRAE